MLANNACSDGTRLRVENLHFELTEDDVNVSNNRPTFISFTYLMLF